MVAGKLEVAGQVDIIEELPQEQVEQLKQLAIGNHEQEPTESRSAMITSDPKLNYVCGSGGTQQDLEQMRKQFVRIADGIDYNIVQKEHAEDVADKRSSLSFMNVKSVEEGIDWYRQNFPKIPEELLEPMARWNFGDLSQITKKDVKNDKKRIARGKKPKVCQGLEVKTGNFVVKF